MNDVKIKHYFLNEYFGNDLNLSERVTRLSLQDQVTETIRVSMEKAGSLQRMTGQLKDKTTAEDIAQSVREIERTAWQLIKQDDPAAYRDFQTLLNSAKSDILKGVEEADPERYKGILDKAYLKVINAAENLNEEALDAAIENAIDKKAMYNAYRIAQTETSRAYNLGVYTRGLADPDTAGFKLDLSDVGTNCDECTELSEADNGAGPGIFPIDDVPETPLHPNCHCLLTPVFVLKGDMDPDDLEVDEDLDFEPMKPMPQNVADEF